MSRTIRKTALHQTLVDCLVRRFLVKREAVLSGLRTEGPVADADQQKSRDLSTLDQALTDLGIQNTH